MTSRQFISNRTWIYLAGIFGMHALAWFISDNWIALLVLIFIGIATFILTIKNLEDGLLIGVLEIFVGGHGHLFDAEIFGFSLSIRMVIFGAVMLGWLYHFIEGNVYFRFSALRDVPWILLVSAVILGSIIGFATNGFVFAFDDMNGYLAIGYILPFITINWTQKSKRELIIALFAGGLWLIIFTLALSYLFTHLDGKSLHELYVFVRDSRLAEITLQTASDASGNVQNGLYQRFLGNSGYFYRIFMQSQFYVVALWLLLVSGSLFSWRNQRLPDIIILSLIGLSAVLILSMSRSFILGAGVGGLFLFIFSFFYGKGALKNIFKRIITFVLIGGFAFLIVWLSIEIPFPKNPDISNAAFYETSANSDRDMAVSSRWALLGPMMDEIEGSPVFGSGFGEEVTFITDDPRVREIDPSGRWTTYRFEWGWQDTWLKMGILGLLAFATYAGFMAYVLKENVKARGYRWILFGLAAGIIMLFVAHTFSPYLNHPIGLVMMMLPIPFLEFDKIKKPELHAKEKLEKLQLQSAKQNVAVNRE